MAIGRIARRQEESKCHFYREEGQCSGPRKPQANQPHLESWESGGATNPGNHFKVHEAQKGVQE